MPISFEICCITYSDFQVNEPQFKISRISVAFAERAVGSSTKYVRRKDAKEERNTDISLWSKYMKTAVSIPFKVN